MPLSSILEKMKKINILKFLAWAVPISILLIILYLNYLPFGYEKTLIIDAGAQGDDTGEFYLEESPALGSRQSLDGETFRYLDGLAYAIYKPSVVLNNANIEATLQGEGVSFILPPDISNVEWDYSWDAQSMKKDFQLETSEDNLYKRFKNSEADEIQSTKLEFKPTEEFAIEIGWIAGMNADLLSGDLYLEQDPKELTLKYDQAEIKYTLPDFFMGNEQEAMIGFKDNEIYLFVNGEQIGKKSFSIPLAGLEKMTVERKNEANSIKLYPNINPAIEIKDGYAYFDGKTRLVLPNTADQFETGPFAVYAEWIPEKTEDNQQIIGHINWEIYQNEKNVSFVIGRTYDKSPFYRIDYLIDENFFNKKHKLLAIYNPTDDQNSGGYTELFVDDAFAGRQDFEKETIWKDYGTENLSIGHSLHNSGKYPYFQGNICQIKFISIKIKEQTASNWSFISDQDLFRLPIFGTGKISKLGIKISK